MRNVLNLQNLGDNNRIKQGDASVIRYALIDANNSPIDIVGTNAIVRLLDETGAIVYEYDTTVIQADDLNVIDFVINTVLKPQIYVLEIVVNNKYVFPSDSSEKIEVTKSTLAEVFNVLSIPPTVEKIKEDLKSALTASLTSTVLAKVTEEVAKIDIPQQKNYDDIIAQIKLEYAQNTAIDAINAKLDAEKQLNESTVNELRTQLQSKASTTDVEAFTQQLQALQTKANDNATTSSDINNRLTALSDKVDNNTALNAYKTEVTEQLNQKADSTALNTLQTTLNATAVDVANLQTGTNQVIESVNVIAQNVNANSEDVKQLKANQESFDSIADLSSSNAQKISGFETTIETMNNSISANQRSIEAVETNVSQIGGTVNNVESKATENTESINALKQAFELFKDEVNAKLEAITVANVKRNRNLLGGTDDFTAPFNHELIEKYGETINDQLWSIDVSNGQRQWNTSIDVEVKPQTDYTLSFDAFAKNGTGQAYIPIFKDDYVGHKAWPDDIINSNDMYRSVTTKVKRQRMTFNTKDASFIRICFVTGDPSYPVAIARPKLEEGTEATPY